MPTTLSCTVFRVKKLLAVALLAVPLTSCDTLDVIGPRPNAELISLAQQASADGQVLGDAPLAQIREFQSSQLFDEAQRLCGTTESGEVPSTCEFERGPGEATGNAEAGTAASLAVDALTQAAEDVPEESVTLLVAQAIDLQASDAFAALDEGSGDTSVGDLDALTDTLREAADDNSDDMTGGESATADDEGESPLVTDDADLELARTMLREEYAAQYGFGMASSFADDPTAARLDALRDASDTRARTLIAALEPSGDVPDAAPGYEFEGVPAPSDPASAGAYAQAQQQALVDQWRATAARAKSPQFRHIAITLAANAQRA